MTALSEGIERARRGVGSGGAGRPAPRRRPAAAPVAVMLLFVLPSAIILLLLSLYPLVYAAMQSLRNGNLIQNGPFVGLANYANILTDNGFWGAALFTLIFTVAGVFGSWLVGLVLALLLRTKIPAGGVFKVLLLLPWVVPVVVSATSWNWLVATPQSPLPVLFSAVGIHDVLFLSNPILAKIVVCAFKVWISFPFMMMMMSSALSGIDVNVYEAAKVDGASTWQRFTQITLPLVKPALMVAVLFRVLDALRMYDLPAIMTQGSNGTTTLSILVVDQIRQGFNSAAALSTITFLIIFIVAFIFVRFLGANAVASATPARKGKDK